jgi:hypothetical protein
MAFKGLFGDSKWFVRSKQYGSFGNARTLKIGGEAFWATRLAEWVDEFLLAHPTCTMDRIYILCTHPFKSEDVALKTQRLDFDKHIRE